MSGGAIYLVRHGETEWNRSRRCQGWLDSPLTAHGRAQAEAVGRRLRELPETAAAELVASPLGRARLTGEIIREILGRSEPLRTDERLREVTLGSWDGLDFREIEAIAPGVFAGEDGPEWCFRSPDGETYEMFAGRIAEWRAESVGEPVIAVTHGIVTRVLRGLYAGLPRRDALRLPVPQDRVFRLAGGRIEEIRAG